VSVRPLALLAVGLLSLGLVACEQTQELVQDAQETVEEGLQTFQWCTAAFRLGAAVENQDAQAALDAARDLEANAPEELQDDAALLLAAAQDAADGDVEALGNQDVREAGQRVAQEARDRCDPSSDPAS
jgi:hypothetical protein